MGWLWLQLGTIVSKWMSMTTTATISIGHFQTKNSWSRLSKRIHLQSSLLIMRHKLTRLNTLPVLCKQQPWKIIRIKCLVLRVRIWSRWFHLCLPLAVVSINVESTTLSTSKLSPHLHSVAGRAQPSTTTNNSLKQRDRLNSWKVLRRKSRGK